MPAARTLAIALALLTGPIPALAQTKTKPALTLADALRVIDAVKAEAARSGWPCVIAVVDDGGWLIAQQRMDDPAMLVSVDLAPGKARSAALYRKPTAELEQSIDTGRVAAVTAGGFVQMQGGVPLVVDGQIVGAVGVSADTPAHDQILADVGRKALNR